MTEESQDCSSSSLSLVPTRNYTGPEEKNFWFLYVHRFSRDQKDYRYGDTWISKERFRTRRDAWGSLDSNRLWKQALRTRVGRSNDIGAFVRLTNSYVLVGGETESENFCRTIAGDLNDISVVNTSLGGCRVVGRTCVGNIHGLIVPDCIYDTELKKIKDELPESVEIRKVEERLSALGNVIVCNDKVALIHPDLDKETEEIIENTLQVDVFRHILVDNPLVGSYCVLNNNGGLVRNDINPTALENLSSLLQLPLVPGTVNQGNKTVASGLIANDIFAYAGMKTTTSEFSSIETAFKLIPV